MNVTRDLGEPGFAELGRNSIFIVVKVIFSLLFRDDSTSLVISGLGSLGVYQKAVVLSMFHFVILIL